MSTGGASASGLSAGTLDVGEVGTVDANSMAVAAAALKTVDQDPAQATRESIKQPLMSKVHWARIVPFAAGLLFGTGLLVSGMINPLKVQNFLDITGVWDPSLAFVMMGALGVAVPGFWLVRRRSSPLADEKFHLTPIGPIDRNLVIGALLFGTGWGLAGICPGPAITSTFMGTPAVHVFLPAMLMGVSTAVLLITTGIPAPRSSKAIRSKTQSEAWRFSTPNALKRS